MATLQCSRSQRSPARTRKAHDRREVSPPAISAERVREMLLEITFALHATRIVRRLDEGVVPKKG
jgi:hypothetical protein